MSNTFKIYQQGESQIIERLVYPRFKGEITFNNPTSDIENIELLDSCNNPTVLAKAMREAGDYIINFKPEKP